MSLLSDLLLKPEEFSADETLLEVGLKETGPFGLFTEGEGLLSRVCPEALPRPSTKTSKLVCQAFDKNLIKLPVSRFLPV